MTWLQHISSGKYHLKYRAGAPCTVREECFKSPSTADSQARTKTTTKREGEEGKKERKERKKEKGAYWRIPSLTTREQQR